MATMSYSITRDIPVILEADVIVVGGGPGGLGAAVMAARAGAKTALVERYGFPGGMAVSGEVQPFMANHARKISLDKPVYIEWAERIHRYLPADALAQFPSDPEAAPGGSRLISKDAAMLAAEDLCLEAGVKLLYHHTLTDVMKTGARIDALVLHSKSGYAAARAACYVDCTGDGDLAVRAGCAFEQGGPTGHCQPMTLCFKLSHVDKARMPDRAAVNALYDEARRRGDVRCPRENVLLFGTFDDDVIHFNTTRVIHKDGANGLELSDAEIDGRRQLREYVVWLRRCVPGFEKARIHSIAHHIGVRETRRILGRNYITRADFEVCRKFPDAIARASYPIDIHNPNGSGTEIVRVPEGDFYEIPYGCIVAKDVDNLLVGGRPISVDHAVHSSMRVMPPACSVGQAAGMAAAMAAQTGVKPADLDGREVRKRLVEKGANL